ncbi:nucleoside phosphorylase domain-containing protein [Mariannaea sp. PMI_226]|nr:nucleoside phosphorylase domain-containing protein [Mariannaea sp. PMI_226]
MAYFQKRSKNDKYTIICICTVSVEYYAAQAFLDEEHDGPEYRSPSDQNTYRLGEMGKHNVVIALTPGWEDAISPAVVRGMMQSFPNIRLALMVGIGGGAPSQKHDIRLGDIAFCFPESVVKYDVHKTIKGQPFEPIGFLTQPESNQISENLLEMYINSAIERIPAMRHRYWRPHSSSDRLYKSGVVHPIGASSCAVACGTDPSKLELRYERTHNKDKPEIHFGLIASGAQVMNNAIVRDWLSAEEVIICFDRATAGLMTHLPCLVIRGISDYSDSHNNEEWQGYAAMAAAAYARTIFYAVIDSKG